MKILARFQAISDNDKAALIRKLMEHSTPDFDFFYIVGLSISMATLCLLLDSVSVVIGSMLIAPIMYPILGVSLGLVMSHDSVLGRSFSTLVKSLATGLVVATVVAFFFGDIGTYQTSEVISRIHPDHLYFIVALIAGAAVSFALARPEWSETLPGIAISVALIPPLATAGIGIAYLDASVIKGASVLLLLNLLGIVTAAAASFMMMNLYQKKNIAESTIRRENERLQEENNFIEAIEKGNGIGEHHEA